MITESKTLQRRAKKYFSKLGVPSWSNDYTFSYTGGELLEMKFAYGSSLHDWIRNKEEYDTERVMDIFGFKNDDNYSWEWVDTNTINLYRI
jgi:hypothetical protein|tara:strand:+ start:2356 stop:2628 length:273 start_codon:yes stop_codon:yes gene_type:complete